MINHECPICKSRADEKNTSDLIHYDCERCGRFFISTEASEDFVTELADEVIKTKISGWIRENQDTKILSHQLEWLINNLVMINIFEKAQKLLKWINAETKHPGCPVAINIKAEDKNCIELLSICWAYNAKEMRYLIDYLVKKQLLSRSDENNSCIPVTISPDGYSYLENIQKNKDSNIGFCAMWFDGEMSKAWEEGFEPAIKKAGYSPRRIDKHPHNGVIVDEIIGSIRKSKFVIADLTENRGGVYYEAGFAKGFGIEVIFTCRSDTISSLHFDVRHYNFLLWDPNKYNELKHDLCLRIEGTLGKGKL